MSNHSRALTLPPDTKARMDMLCRLHAQRIVNPTQTTGVELEQLEHRDMNPVLRLETQGTAAHDGDK